MCSFHFSGSTPAAGGMERSLLYQSTHSRVASSTSESECHSPSRWIFSVLNRPSVVSARVQPNNQTNRAAWFTVPRESGLTTNCQPHRSGHLVLSRGRHLPSDVKSPQPAARRALTSPRSGGAAALVASAPAGRARRRAEGDRGCESPTGRKSRCPARPCSYRCSCSDPAQAKRASSRHRSP